MTKPTFAELLAAKKASLAASLSTLPTVDESTLTTVDEPKPESKPDSKPVSFLDKLKQAKAQPEAQPEVEAKPETKPEAAELVAIPKVTISADVIALSNKTIQASQAAPNAEAEASLDLIKARITELQNMNGLDLSLAMDGLKTLILANPSACSQLLPEDVGDMVSALRRMTGNSKAAAQAAPTKGRKAKAPAMLDADDLSALIAGL